jgi:hypothetical protein
VKSSLVTQFKMIFIAFKKIGFLFLRHRQKNIDFLGLFLKLFGTITTKTN